MADTKKRNPLVGFAVVIVIGYFLYSCSSQKSTSPEDVAAEAAQTAEQKRKGFHCLSAWDGSHAKFKSAIKMQMRESDSFEHIETLVTPVSADGTHQLSMR